MKYNRQAFCNSSDTEKNRIIEEEISLETHNGTTKDDLLMLLEWAYYKKNKQDSESNDGWIPVDERLPEEAGTYIINALDGKRNIVTFAKWQNGYKRFNMIGARAYWKVVAWRPLPEPYRTERSNEHDGE